jgi:hypothetical protein
MPKKNNVITKPICNSLLNGKIIKNKGKAIREPIVPGAFFDKPAPNPRAKKCQKLLNKNLILSKMCKTFFYFFYYFPVYIQQL